MFSLIKVIKIITIMITIITTIEEILECFFYDDYLKNWVKKFYFEKYIYFFYNKQWYKVN